MFFFFGGGRYFAFEYGRRYEEVPWVEFKERPDQEDQELYDRWNAMPAEPVRAFKVASHPNWAFGDGWWCRLFLSLVYAFSLFLREHISVAKTQSCPLSERPPTFVRRATMPLARRSSSGART